MWEDVVSGRSGHEGIVFTGGLVTRALCLWEDVAPARTEGGVGLPIERAMKVLHDYERTVQGIQYTREIERQLLKYTRCKKKCTGTVTEN